MRKETLIKCVLLIAAQYEKFKVHENKPLIDMWFDMFKDEDDLLFEEAIKNVMLNCEFTPKPKNIADALFDLKNIDAVEPGEVWDEINKNMRSFGIYKTSEGYEALSDIAKKVVNGMGGYRVLCLSESGDFDRTQALKMAKGFIDRKNKDLRLTNSMKKEQLENKQRLLQLTEGIGNK